MNSWLSLAVGFVVGAVVVRVLFPRVIVVARPRSLLGDLGGWQSIVGALGPDLVRLAIVTIQQHAATRAQRPVAELTHDDLRAAAADLVARSVPVDATLERASGGAWKVPQPPDGAVVTGISYQTGDGKTTHVKFIGARLFDGAQATEEYGWHQPSYDGPVEVLMSTDHASIVADPEDDATKAHGGNA